MFYLKKNPNWFSLVYPNRVWRVATKEKILFLTFDDGPIPGITSFVLDTLKEYNAKASFFCVGENVQKHRDLYARILNDGHVVGNHTMQHLNASKTDDEMYLDGVLQATKHIDSKLFRPPYGRLSGFLEKQLSSVLYDMKVIMWTVLSADFDDKVSPEKCRDNVLLHSKPGDIIVFHDSIKAEKNIRFALPLVLDYFSKKGFRFLALTNEFLPADKK